MTSAIKEEFETSKWCVISRVGYRRGRHAGAVIAVHNARLYASQAAEVGIVSVIMASRKYSDSICALVDCLLCIRYFGALFIVVLVHMRWLDDITLALEVGESSLVTWCSGRGDTAGGV